MPNDFCENYPYYSAGIDTHQRIFEDKSHVNAEYQSLDSVSRKFGHVEYNDSSLNTHQEEGVSLDFTGQQSSFMAKLPEGSEQMAVNEHDSNCGTWYSVNNDIINQAGYQTQEYYEYSNMLPPYYASEKKYIELWVQCPGQSGGIDSCEHSNQPICYSDCYEPAINGRECLNWENKEMVYEDGHGSSQIPVFHSSTLQYYGSGRVENHEKQLSLAKFHMNPGQPSTPETCDGENYDEEEVHKSNDVSSLGESLFRVTSDSKYDELEATILHSGFKGRRDHGQITKHVTKSVSFSSESIKIEVLNHKSSFEGSLDPGSLVSEKIQTVRSRRRSRNNRKSKVPIDIDVASAVSSHDSSKIDATYSVEPKDEKTLMAYEPHLSHCDRFERYLNSELSKNDFDSKYLRAECPINDDALSSVKTADKSHNSPLNESKIKSSTANEGRRVKVKEKESTKITTGQCAQAPPTIKPSTSSSPKIQKVTNEIDTLCKAVTRYLPEMCHEQTLIAGQLILTVLGEGVKNSLSKSTQIVTRKPQISRSSTTSRQRNKDQPTQDPETQSGANHIVAASNVVDAAQSGDTKKRNRRRPRWRKNKTSEDQQDEKAPGVDSGVTTKISCLL